MKKIKKKVSFLVWIGMMTVIIFSPISVQADSAFEKERPNKISIGLGVPYGILGGNLEIEKSRLAISGGLGYDLAGLGWAIGARAYLNEPAKTFRLRAGCFYGIVVLVEKKYISYGYGYGYDSSTTYEDYPGFAPTLGFEWRFGEDTSFEFDLVYLIYDEDGIKKELKEEGYSVTEDFGSPIKISLGVGKRW